LLGPRALSGGLATAGLGLLCHFVIAFLAATVYYGISRALPWVLQYAIAAGAIYGGIVFFFMNRGGAFRWSDCVFLHEPRRGATVRCPQIPVLAQDDDHWSHHSYLLCRPAHR